jgi:flavin reductase (DIM6/NTAB) family NADH-FMN oxidoreductase RutF
MDLGWGDERRRAFVTNVGLVTTHGPNGEDIMAAEWAFQLSYSPGLLAVSVGSGKATAENILATKEFGFSLASEKQNVLASVAGKFSGKKIDKIGLLTDLGFGFSEGRQTRVVLPEGASFTAECRLVNSFVLGDHTLFVGEILEASASGEEPLVYHGRNYFKIGEGIERPGEEFMTKLGEKVAKREKKT